MKQTIKDIFDGIRGMIFLSVFAISLLWFFFIWYPLTRLLFWRSDKRAVEHLRKNPGPYFDRNGRPLYVWLKVIEPDEYRVIGLRFWFELREEVPPPDLVVEHRFGMKRERVVRISSEPYQSRTSYAYVFFSNFTKTGNLQALADFIKQDVPKNRPPLAERMKQNEEVEGPLEND